MASSFRRLDWGHSAARGRDPSLHVRNVSSMLRRDALVPAVVRDECGSSLYRLMTKTHPPA
jgi:hypothetical protein